MRGEKGLCLEMRNGEKAGLDPAFCADAILAAAEAERRKDLEAAVADMAIWDKTGFVWRVACHGCFIGDLEVELDFGLEVMRAKQIRCFSNSRSRETSKFCSGNFEFATSGTVLYGNVN
ncbi:hypothetical protein NC651_010369 [Populus alba x Populus x berolinensis]|nr:hypothetical protein NC651_010369 [Populus alba x Populus x berolinensis]